ncbi:MAG TPA: LLM class flavin-dependent oxidoreductase [Candidatus Dormibacteraeota bacterium]|nr:LLM class flavin-dependent oxidoreductase [Candidatus Dormibacteraeota bacterium]
MTSPQDIEFGLDSFVPISVDESGRELSGDAVIRNTVEEAVLADAVGIDSFNIAEHYRQDMMDSAASIILAAIAGRTKRIRLGTAVTVLSTQDPVRVYTQFATLDAVSNGRAQLIAGRGSLVESFPLFGYDLDDYEEIFEEKLDLLMRLLRDQPVTWSGKFRSPLTHQYLSPPLPEGHLPVWVGVGGSPQSVVRAARYGLPLMLAVIGGPPIRFLPLVELYKRALDKFGKPRQRIGMHSHGLVAGTDQEAAEIQWPHWAHVFEQAAAERGWARPTMERFQAEVDEGSLYLGSVETVATKIAWVIQLLGLSRFDLAYATGRVPHEQKMATIELYGKEVIPLVRELLAEPAGEAESGSQKPAASAALPSSV